MNGHAGDKTKQNKAKCYCDGVASILYALHVNVD